MKATEKDEIKFHILFNMIREHLNVPLNIVCYGLCSDSMMNYIETGERLPDYRMRNRIMARLGVSSEEYEDFVHYDEYERWERCQKLIDAVEQKKQDLAEHILNELLTDVDIDNKIEYQFLMDMKGRILEMEGTVWDEIARVYEEAVELSMPDFDNIDWNRYIFSPEEFYILVRWLMAKTRYAADGNRAYILPGEFQCSPEDYLSDMEVTILKNIAFESDVEEYKNDLVDKCEKYYKKHIKKHASLYEFIMGTVASRYGDQGKYTASNEIAGFIIEEATKLFRPHAIHRNLFCITWNNAMSTGNYYESSYLDALKNCKAIATFCKDFYTASFYDKRINGFINNEDWTL